MEDNIGITSDMRMIHDGIDPAWLKAQEEKREPFNPGPITSNMQMYPEVDIEKEIPMLYGDTDEEPILISTRAEYRDFMMARRGMPARKTRSHALNNLDDMVKACIDGKKYSADEWRRIHIMRFPFNVLINETGKEIKANIPVIPPTSVVHDSYTKRSGVGKVFCYSNGVIGIRQMWNAGEPNFLVAVREWLTDNGYRKPDNDNSKVYDCELNGRKFFGTLNVNIGKDKIVSESIFTFDYDDEIFRNLPPEHYSRAYQPGKVEGERGITGLRNEIPGIDVNKWIEEILRRIGYR